MKKYIVLLTLLVTIGLTACGINKDSSSLYDQGLEVVKVMDEMAKSDSYTKYFTGNDEILKIIEGIAVGNYSEPKEVYEVVFPENIHQLLFGGTDAEISMSDELDNIMRKKMMASIVTQINAYGGSMNLAASTVCTASKSFINDELENNLIYIYVYDDAAPIAITFLKESDDIVSANGSFLISDELKALDAESITMLFEEMNVTVRNIEK